MDAKERMVEKSASAQDIVLSPTMIEVLLERRRQIKDAFEHLRTVTGNLGKAELLTGALDFSLAREQEILCNRMIDLERAISLLPCETPEDVVRKARLLIEVIEDAQDHYEGALTMSVCRDIIKQFDTVRAKRPA